MVCLGVTHSLLWIGNLTMRAVIGLQEELDKRHNTDSFFVNMQIDFLPIWDNDDFENLLPQFVWEKPSIIDKK